MPVNLDRTKDPIAADWRSYKLWQSDLWECKGCGTQVIVGHAQQAYAEHFQPDYSEVVETADPMLRVEDC